MKTKHLFTYLLTFMTTMSLFVSICGAEEGSLFTMPNNPVVVIETSQGNIEVKLFTEDAPKACENFLRLSEKGYYDGTVFHRIIPDFMIQGGDPSATGRGGESIWGKAFEDEVTRRLSFDKPGILAMANAGPNTNGSQFFITTAKTPWLNMRHTIFGEVTSGMDVVKKIEAVETGYADKPVEDQKVNRIYLKKD